MHLGPQWYVSVPMPPYLMTVALPALPTLTGFQPIKFARLNKTSSKAKNSNGNTQAAIHNLLVSVQNDVRNIVLADEQGI